MPPTPNNPQPGPQNTLPAPPTAPQPVYLTPPPANLPPLPVTIAGSQLPISPAPPAGFLGNLGTPATGAGGPSQPPALPSPGQLPSPPGIPNLVLPGVGAGQALQQAAPFVSAFGAGGAGDLLGNVGTLLTRGPQNAIAAAIGAIREQIEQGLKSAVEGIGQALRSVAALDPRGLLQPIDDFLDKIPLFGPALAEATRQFTAFIGSIKDTAQRLAGFSGELAVATAQADVAQILGDLRRAQQLGSGLARFTEAESRLSQTAQDILASILEQLLPTATNILEILQGVLETLKANKETAQGAAAQASALPHIFGGILVPYLTEQARRLREIARNTAPRDDPPSTALILRDLLGLSLADSPAPPRAAGFTGFNE